MSFFLLIKLSCAPNLSPAKSALSILAFQQRTLEFILLCIITHYCFSYKLIEGEMYPPTVADVPIKMSYPSRVPPENQIAIGQEVFGLHPGLGMYATLWLREHNRVCDILKAEHPTWGDEQLFQTSRLIIIGELAVFEGMG